MISSMSNFSASVNGPVRVGFVGVGLMGHGLAKHALAAGHAVRLMLRSDEDRRRCEDLLQAGALGVARCDALAEQCDVVVVCVTGSPQVEDAVLGATGLVHGLRRGATVVDCSTALPDSTRRIGEALAARGIDFLDAAMTGTPKEAEAGEINLLVGGEAAVLERVRPVLRCFAKNIYACGALGAGHTVKLLHQFVVLSNAAVLAEAYACASKTGVDTAVLGEVIGSGGANSTAFQRLRAYVDEGDDTGFRFSLANALKDMRYYTQMMANAQVVAGIAGAVHASYTVANNAGLADRFVPHLVDSVRRMNGAG